MFGDNRLTDGRVGFAQTPTRIDICRSLLKKSCQSLQAASLPCLIFLTALVSYACGFDVPRDDFKAEYLFNVENIRNSALATDDVNSVLDVLVEATDQVKSLLPANMGDEMERALAIRLDELQRRMDQHITGEYKRSLLATRLLELSGHVVELPYRNLPSDVLDRRKASRQYASALDKFERAGAAKNEQLSQEVIDILIGPIRRSLTLVQSDVFRRGYGRPLGPQEAAELDGILDSILRKAADRSQTLGPDVYGPAHLSEAASLANEGWQKVVAFLRSRFEGDPTPAALREWYDRVKPIADKVNSATQRAETLETEAILERARREGA